jgi:hypothetical protein
VLISVVPPIQRPQIRARRLAFGPGSGVVDVACATNVERSW